MIGKQEPNTLTLHEAYLRIASNAYLKGSKMQGDIEFYYKNQMAGTLDTQGEALSKLASEREENWYISIVFSALCTEAFINHYGIEKSSRSYFDNYLDKLSTYAK